MCILHLPGGKAYPGKVKNLDEKTWAAVKEADASRRAKFSKSQYFTLSLPDMFTENDGNHYQCYRRFIAIPKVEIKDDLTSSIPKLHQLRCDVTHTVTSSSGVFEEKCIFCPHQRRRLSSDTLEYLSSCETDNGEEIVRMRSEYCRMMQC